MLHFRRNTPEREEWWAVSDQTGEVFGPFDPGTVWFETPLHVRGGDLLRLQRVADLILNEAHASWERLQRALAFMQPNGSSVYRRFMDSGALPRQTPALGLAGGLDVPGYLGDGGATDAGLHVDDSKDGMTFNGPQSVSGQGKNGEGYGHGYGGQSGRSGRSDQGGAGGGGGGNGSAGTSGANSQNGRTGGSGGITTPPNIWEALRSNVWDLNHMPYGGAGGNGGHRGGGDSAGGSSGGNAGDALLEISTGTLTTVARTLKGSDGNRPSYNDPGSGGGGSGGFWLGIAASIAYGSGSIDVSGGSGGTARGRGGAGGAGGDGRAVQVYFDSKADNLQVTNGVQSQFRILRSVPIGQNTFL